MTGIALDKAEGVESVDVSFASLYDKAQEPVKEYKARYIESENKWSTHVRSGELPDGVYDVKVAMHTKDGNTKFVFYNLIVDSSLTSRITTL
jgi:hypothetical protein